MSYTDFMVVESESSKILAMRIKNFLSLGWRLHGEMTITSEPETFWSAKGETIYSQAMVK